MYVKFLLVSVFTASIISCSSELTLESIALQEIEKSRQSLGGPQGNCPSVEDAELKNITRGAIYKDSNGKSFEKPIPAMIAQQVYTCIPITSGVRAPMTIQWTLVAYDKNNGSVFTSVGLKMDIERDAYINGFKPDS